MKLSVVRSIQVGCYVPTGPQSQAKVTKIVALPENVFEIELNADGETRSYMLAELVKVIDASGAPFDVQVSIR